MLGLLLAREELGADPSGCEDADDDEDKVTERALGAHAVMLREGPEKETGGPPFSLGEPARWPAMQDVRF